MRSFTDRVAVITGAASGIGRALAIDLAGQGCALALVDVDDDGLHATAREVKARGRSVSTHVVDVADRAAMLALPEAVMATHGRVDILVNNAGVSVAGTLEEQSFEDLQWIFGINLWGVIHGIKAFLPRLRESDDAYIVNLSSVFGLVGVPRQSSYCATKFAVRGISEAIAAELADSSVRVLCVHPGGVRTKIAERARYVGEAQASRQRWVEFFHSRALPADRAAARIVSAMRAGSERVLVAPEAPFIDLAKRLMPVVPSRWLAWIDRRVAKDVMR
jgi:NAD(P)-dependent dehydrogenase (short-subunit alcohol dehydrogenase family)